MEMQSQTNWKDLSILLRLVAVMEHCTWHLLTLWFKPTRLTRATGWDLMATWKTFKSREKTMYWSRIDLQPGKTKQGMRSLSLRNSYLACGPRRIPWTLHLTNYILALVRAHTITCLLLMWTKILTMEKAERYARIRLHSRQAGVKIRAQKT